ncbi:HesB/YadR/YfhF family protein [Bacillus sp. DJP31]|uniref:HesB/YadR/YfhF family protein n=1 Tax=Bacillus sp. DJP31 TaxID=3409789 RepID=UPI003BB61340
MKLTIEDKAANWYLEELYLHQGDFIRFFVRYGGYGTVQSGFSLGVNKDTPDEIGLQVESKGITFFVEQKDLWYFDGHDLQVQYNDKYREPEFHYEKN